MKILITGGAGYIGSHVSHLLVDRGYNVTIIDSLLTGNKKLIPKKAKFINSDISNVKKINKIATHIPPNVFLYLYILSTKS